MHNKSDDHLLTMQATIKSNRQDYDDKTKNITEYLTEMIISMMDKIKILKTSPDKKDPPKDQYYTTLVPANKRDLPLEGVNSTKVGDVWTLKHEIRSPKFYEILIKTEIKGDTSLELTC